MQEDFGDHFDGDRARVVWSLGPGYEDDRSAPAPQPVKEANASRSELQLVPDVSGADRDDTVNELSDARPKDSLPPHPRPGQREVPRSFTLSAKMRGPSKKKTNAGLRTLGGTGVPAKHVDARSMAALLKGVSSTPQQAQRTPSTAMESGSCSRSPPVALVAQQGLNLAANSTPVAGLQHEASPHMGLLKSAPRSQLRSLKAPPTCMTMSKLLAKRPLPTPDDLPGTPAGCDVPETPCPRLTLAMTPQASLVDCTTPIDGLRCKAVAPATTPCLSSATPMLMPGSNHRNPSRTPASRLQSSRSAGGKTGHQPGVRKLPGAMAVQTALQSGRDAMPQCLPVGSGDTRQRTHADLFAGIPKQDKPSSLFTPTAPKPKRQKDKSGGMQQKLEDELESLRHRQEAGLRMTASELEGVPHLRFQTVCEPAFEGQLVKLLCDVENVRLASQGGTRDRGQAGAEGTACTDSSSEEAAASRILEEASQAFVFFDHSAEKHVGVHVGSQFTVLAPWDVVMTPFSELPVVLAHVTIPQPQE